MGKASSALSSQSIEEKDDDRRSERSGKSSVGSSAMMRPGRTMESAPKPTQATNRSPTRLPTRKPGEALVGPPLTQAVNRVKIEPQPEDARTATLERSQDQRRESWETLPPSGRPSLSSAAHSSVLDTSRGPSISLSRPNGHSQPATDDFEGDVSWETVESRRASAAAPLDPFFTPRKPTLDQPTISAAPVAADSQFDSTSALPTRANMSYVSPDASTLRHALAAHQLSLVHSSTSPSLTLQNPHARPINPRLVSLSPPELANRLRGRESATLDEILKMSLMSAKKAGEDEEWLYEEGVSQVMRADLEGVSTPWRGSVVVREQGVEDTQRWQEEVEEAKERVAMLERDLRAREAQLDEERRHNAEERARVERERHRWEGEMESLDAEKRRVEAEGQAVALKHADEGRRWEAEREQLAAQSTPRAKAAADDPELQLALHLATSSYRQLATLSDGIAERAKGDRDECRTALASLAVLSEGLRMWEETLSVVMT